MQGADGSNGSPMSGQRTAEPPMPMKTAEEDGSVGPRQEQYDSVNAARSEHDALARREYDLLALEATEGGSDNTGAAGVEDGHGALANQKGTET